MAKKAPKPPKDPKKPGRIKQIRQSYTMTKAADPKIGLILLGVFALAALAAFAVMLLLFKTLAFSIVFGVMVGILATLIVFGRRAQRSAISQIEGKPGAAAAALGMLKRGWKTDPAIAITKQQDVVTRVVGPPGIVLIGEGNPNRLRPLLTSERRKHERVASDTPIHEVLVGHDPGQVPLAKLTRHVTKLGREIKPAQMTDVLQRIKALDANRSSIPMPKGPVPTSMKGMRGNMRGR
jgi:MFS superfamily sulfate permease-like transporter